jgi:hypothetical protein
VKGAYPSLRTEGSTMNDADFNDGKGVPYKIPIVHYNSATEVSIVLSNAKSTFNDIKANYVIDDQNVEKDVEFEQKVKNTGTELDIVDINKKIKGRVEFREISYDKLEPVLNFVTINTDKSEIDYSTVISDINNIYSTINIVWS